MSSRASVGGAAGAHGVGFQDEVFAWASAAMLAEQDLPMARLPGTVVRVGAQTGFEVDDVAVESALGGLALCQVKAGLGLGTTERSPLAEALDQVVAQYIAGVPAAGGRRQPRRGDDLLVVVTDAAAPGTVREDLATGISRTASLPPGTPLGSALTTGQAKALKIALGHLRRSWIAHGGSPTDEDLRDLLGVLAVLVIDTADGGPDRATALATLRGLVPAGQETQAWQALVASGKEAAVGREWRDRPTLVAAVARRGVVVGPGRSAADDIDVLRAVTASNLTALRPSTTLPISGGIHLPRPVDTAVAEAGRADGGVLLVGDAGSGKTGVAVSLAAARAAAGEDVVLLRAADLAAGAVGGSARLTRPVDQVLLAWTGAAAGTVIIDALDAARGSDDRARLTDLVTALAGSRWQVIATVRTYDVLFGPTLRAAFAGAPVTADAARRDRRLDGVRHVRVDDLTDAELLPVTESSGPLADFYAAATPALQRLLRNPFNLRVAAELLAPGTPLAYSTRQRLNSAVTRLDLLAAYWEHRVDASADAIARTDVLTRVSEQMLGHRKLRVLSAPPAVLGTDSAAVAGLLSDDVLAVEDQPSTTARRVIVFSHHILFDYTATRCVLLNPLNPLHLLDLLAVDPALPLVARPSLDMLFDDLWAHGGDRTAFWRLALALAGSPHLLASLAAAARLVAAGPSADDLQPLAAACMDADASHRQAGHGLLSQVIGVLRATTVIPDPDIAAASPGLAALAAEFARGAVTGAASWDCLASTIDVITALELRRPALSGTADASARAQAVTDLLDACRRDPVQFEQIVVAAAHRLPGAIGVDASHAAAVARLLDDPAAVSQWGGRILAELVGALPQLATADPTLARRVALAVWTFDETRDEKVDFSASRLLPMTTTRSQEAQHTRWRLGDVFPDLCRVDLVTATGVFADAADTDIFSRPDDQELWPLMTGEVRGWLSHGAYLETMDRADTVTAMATAVRDALAEAGANRREPNEALDRLVEALHSSRGWAALLTPASDPEGLAAAILPALDSGSLLAHPDTHEPAGGLLRVLASHADRQQHARLEGAVRAAGVRAAAAGRRESVVDQLLGCLDAARIADAGTASRLAALAAEGGLPPLSPQAKAPGGPSGRHTLAERLTESGMPVTAELAAAVEDLDDDVALLGSRGPTDDVNAAWQRLPERFLAADHADAAASTAPDEVRRLLVRAAALLAGDDRVTPSTPLGERIRDVLLDAATSPDAGQPVG